MKLLDGVARVKLAMDNVKGRKATDALIGQVMNNQYIQLTRKLVEKDQAYTNHNFKLELTAARQVHAVHFTYRLPSWMMAIVAVREFTGTSGRQGRVLNRVHKHARSDPGWRYTASNQLALMGWPAAIDLDIWCAKRPAKMTQGTLPSQAGLDANQMKLDADSSADALIYPHETVKDAYAGGLFEISGSTSGQLLRCVASTTDATGRVLTFEEDWGSVPVATDTYEMHVEIPDEHTELLVLLTARRFLAQEGNAVGLGVYNGEIRELWDSYMHHIANRDLQEAHYIVENPDSFISERDAFETY